MSKHKPNDQTIRSTSLEQFKNSGDSVILGIVSTPLQIPLLSCFRSLDLWGQLVSKCKPNNQSILSTSSEQFKNNDGSVTVSIVPIPHPTPEILILVPVSNSLWRQLVSNKSNDQTVPSTSLAHVMNSGGSVTMGIVPLPTLSYQPPPPPPWFLTLNLWKQSVSDKSNNQAVLSMRLLATLCLLSSTVLIKNQRKNNLMLQI